MHLLQKHTLLLKSFTFAALLLLILLITVSAENAVTSFAANFNKKDEILYPFQHMVLDKSIYREDRKLYIGGLNTLYQINKDNLEEEQFVKTGKVRDNVACHPHTIDKCTYPLEEQDNINKLLLIDDENGRLIFCGSVLQGICDLRELNNVENLLNDFSNREDLRGDTDYIAANGDLSTVAFIAGIGAETSMYVGSSKTNEDTPKFYVDYELLMTVSKRRIEKDSMDLYQFSSYKRPGTIDREGLFTQRDWAESGFRVNFIQAFAFTNSGYFVITHPPTSTSSEHQSFISQICLSVTSDSAFNSYLELPISAGSRFTNEVYNQAIASAVSEVGRNLISDLQTKYRVSSSSNKNVVFVSFIKSRGSAVALFPMFEIEKNFFKIITDCLSGSDNSQHVQWQNENELHCGKRDVNVEELCNRDSFLWEVAGLRQRKHPLDGSIVYESSDTIVTAIAVTVINQKYTAMFLGTSDGRILKVKVDGTNGLTKPYEVIDIDTDNVRYHNIPYHVGSPKILPDMLISQDLSHLYAMSERVVVKVAIQNCSRFDSCNTCLGLNDPAVRDPFCVWCTLENKCRGFGKCSDSGSRVSTTACPKIISDVPVAMSQKNEGDWLDLQAFGIPKLDPAVYYKCRFKFSKSNIKETMANYDGMISCPLPSLYDNIRFDQGKAVVPVSLKSPNGIDFVSTDVIFYSCSDFNSCTQCLDSKFSCHWCISSDQINSPRQCQHTQSLCQESIREVKEKQSCPQLEKLSDDDQYIHDQEEKEIEIPVQNLNKLGDGNYICQVSFGSKHEEYPAARSGNNIQCRIKGNVPAGLTKTNATIMVFWKTNYVIDNPFNIGITMYRCSSGSAVTCGQCLETDAALNCGWCEQSKTCSLCKSCLNRQSCDSLDSSSLTSWLASQSQRICKNPRIVSFEPKSAPINGETVVTLYGQNLGITNTASADHTIIIGEHPCRIEQNANNTESSVKCKVGRVKSNYRGNIEFCISEGGNCGNPEYRAISDEKFKFVTPTISEFAPLNGYERGGTKITFKGSNLKTGNHISVSLDKGIECIVDRNLQTDSSFSCHMNCTKRDQHSSAQSYRMKVSFDGFKTIPPDFYHFISGVIISSVNPMKSIKSGGIKTIVHGLRLEVVQTLFMEVYLNDKDRFIKECEPGYSDYRFCYTPQIRGVKLGNYQLRFIVDDCHVLSPATENSFIEYKPDPDLDEFGGEGSVKDYSGGKLVITGRNLCADPLNCDKETVIVNIGESACNISSLDAKQIVCSPQDGLTGTQRVTVKIGNYEQELGSLEFKNQTQTIITIIVAVAILIMLIVAVVCFVFKRRSNQNLETVRELQMRLDMMEAKVAKECKEAFAELQTDMTELDNMCGGGIPFRTYPDYIMRVFFPDPIMYERLTSDDQQLYIHNGRHFQNAIRGRVSALDTFDKLIADENFLLIFIKTLEQQQGFTMKDKGNVAGLLMIVLQDRLQYATDILTQLLKDLIQSSLDSNRHPKLLLRRTESVAEKMLTHWFSVLLYPFLKDCAGDPLYWLFRAIKQQIDKGPVDAITGEAKYSLSEDKLIRQTVEYTPLVLKIFDEDIPNNEPVVVKVLDCDTISQAKEKIIAVLYKNSPSSQHPDTKKFQLKLHRNEKQIIMLDEDSTSKVEGIWKKINMLRDYHVKDESQISLQNVNSSETMLNSSFSSADHHSRSGLRTNGSGNRLMQMEQQSLLRPQHSRSGTPTIEDDKRLWHLVKESDLQGPGAGDNGTLPGYKIASEIYLTRLLATKGTIQKFVDDLFETVFTTVQRGHGLPLAIKHMFDFLDQQANYHRITDQDVVYTWKSNCLPLRFWVNLIKNPHFLFDVDKSPLVDSCLTVIGQTFMDSCSTSDHKLGKDAPANKLLYAKDIPNYKQWVKRYYEEIRYMDEIKPIDMKSFLKDEFRSYKDQFNSEAALTQLYQFVQRYQNEIYDALESDSASRRAKLKQKLEQVGNAMMSTV